jgi:hypothetical protein
MSNKPAFKPTAGAIALAWLLCLFLPASSPAALPHQEKERSSQENPEGILMEIYREVQELGFREDEDFIKREFHFDLDGILSNREEHIVILSHKIGNGDRMILQVTTFGKAANQFYVRYPVNVNEIQCYIEGDALQIRKCGYEEHEARALLPEILKGIRSEKKLLRMIEHRK